MQCSDQAGLVDVAHLDVYGLEPAVKLLDEVEEVPEYLLGVVGRKLTWRARRADVLFYHRPKWDQSTDGSVEINERLG